MEPITINKYPEHLLRLEKRMLKRGWVLVFRARPVGRHRKTAYVFKNTETGESMTFDSQSVLEAWLKQEP